MGRKVKARRLVGRKGENRVTNQGKDNKNVICSFCFESFLTLALFLSLGLALLVLTQCGARTARGIHGDGVHGVANTERGRL